MAGSPGPDLHAELFKRLALDRPLAHKVVFAERHAQVSPPFHDDLIRDFHSKRRKDRYSVYEVFRGGGKSTIAEEGIALKGGFREFDYCLIVGASEDRALDRLKAIKHEIEANDRFNRLFGDLTGKSWSISDSALELSSGRLVACIGKGQKIRGIKFREHRPDFLLIDDLESREDMRQPHTRDEVRRWLMTELLPACDVSRVIVRMLATPLDPAAIPERLKKDDNWTVHVYPVRYLDDAGQQQSAWPERVPLEEINEMERSYQAHGMSQEFASEYLCEATAPEDKPFRQDMIRLAGIGDVPVQVRTWQATYAMIDPARTTGSKSADTGWVVWSWIGARLVVWASGSKKMMPDEIVDLCFTLHRDHHLTTLYVERDGLEEWLMQPIRHRQVQEGVYLPIESVKAPNSKNDFIRALRIYFQAREVVFAQPLPELTDQLLSFPTGNKDALNALAYAPRLRAGAPVYDGFGARNVGEGLARLRGRTYWLCLGADRRHVVGALCQLHDGQFRIYADWVREGEAAAVLKDIITEANLETGGQFRLIGGPLHFNQYLNVGLRQAAARLPMDMQQGTAPEVGRAEIRNLLAREVRGEPALLVDFSARWVLNGFAGGYARTLEKGGQLADSAADGPYKLLMEALESFAGVLRAGRDADEDDEVHYAATKDGRRYVSARA